MKNYLKISKNKKSEMMTFNVIVAAAIALLIMIVLILIITGKLGGAAKFEKCADEKNNPGFIRYKECADGERELAYSGSSPDMKCCIKIEDTTTPKK